MYTRLITSILAIFSIVGLSQTALSATQPSTGPYHISSVKTDIQSNGLNITVLGNNEPSFNTLEKFDPFQLVVDIAEAELDAKLQVEKLIPTNDFAGFHLSVMKDQKPPIIRFAFTLNENSTYDVQRIGNNIKIDITAPSAAKASSASAAESNKSDSKSSQMASSIFDAPKKDVDLLKPTAESTDSEVEKLKDSFSFSGYKNERISVDFYKIDLHNVFRLFRQISDKNIIVDEAVNGSVTIALNDVPWDFALDIILNLADLKKEERYNTIVVYPKNKTFLWPERAMDNLSFEADTAVVQEEALIIQQSASQPVEIMQAKEALIKAKEFEKKEDYEEAAVLYEEAVKLWPDNTKIANKLANLYLGRLNMNAKALHYAEKALEKDPSDTRAALYGAISSANMDRIPEAMEFFNQSISGTPPMKEALISYAAFSENNNQPEAALKLLESFSANYGDNLHVMVSARLYDKLGERDKAAAEYRAVLSSGFQMRPDLKEYVQNRVAAGNF